MYGYREVLNELERDGWALENYPNYQDDFMATSIACQQDGFALQWASPRLRDNEDLVEIAISQGSPHGWVFEFASPRLQDDLRMATLAVKENPYALSCVSERLKNDPSLVQSAITHDALTFRYAGTQAQDNNYLAKLAIEGNPYTIRWCSDRLKNDKRFVLQALEKEPKVFKYIGEQLIQECGSNDPIQFLHSRILQEELNQSLQVKPEPTPVKKKTNKI